MNISAIREKLYDYIKTAEDKKIKAIFTLVESEIKEKSNWWEDEEFVAELDERVQNCVDGKEKGFTLEELDEEIKSLKQVST